MNKETYKDKSDSELHRILAEKREELRKLRFGVAGSKSRDTKKGKNVRKEIARVLTELNKK